MMKVVITLEYCEEKDLKKYLDVDCPVQDKEERYSRLRDSLRLGQDCIEGLQVLHKRELCIAISNLGHQKKVPNFSTVSFVFRTQAISI
jgi:hypothetical protein